MRLTTLVISLDKSDGMRRGKNRCASFVDSPSFPPRSPSPFFTGDCQNQVIFDQGHDDPKPDPSKGLPLPRSSPSLERSPFVIVRIVLSGCFFFLHLTISPVWLMTDLSFPPHHAHARSNGGKVLANSEPLHEVHQDVGKVIHLPAVGSSMIHCDTLPR
ncbi:hypothetical protein IE53DRAFT_126003 [Violaceomyces palustris]|uniref:Uncharacterized protein n=1 Tax=Violaceomyces palustris TaxID=1673888 RepID=A0ACD0NVK5_9BASI|nr:hypothetical protein IE53DRAFT_126003 [Violaceomyces palustris]